MLVEIVEIVERMRCIMQVSAFKFGQFPNLNVCAALQR